MRELALEVLGEVPDQFVDYMVMKSVQPELLFNPGKPSGEQEAALLSVPRIDEEPASEECSPANGNVKAKDNFTSLNDSSAGANDKTKLIKE